MTPKVVGSIGLCLDILGVYLIWRYGLTGGVESERDAASRMESRDRERDERMARARARMDRYSARGIGLLILGFLLQLISNWI
jgi:hypothetical protein